MEILSVLCPLCKSDRFEVTQSRFDVPYFGEVMVTTDICPDCRYRHTDVMTLDESEPARYRYTLRDLDGLNVRVVRSSTSHIRFAELGVRIDPGTAAEGYVTNVEGLLDRIEGVLQGVKRAGGSDTTVGDLDRVNELLSLIAGYREGRGELNIVMEDPMGNSAMIGDGVIKEPLTEEEVLSLSRY